jgi:hypothetical protein
MLKKIFISFYFAAFLPSLGLAESISLPLKTVKKPAADLISPSGQLVDVGVVAARAKAGEDLSLYNPQDNRMWQNQSYPAIEEMPGSFPKANTGVQFLSEEAALPFTYMSRVQSLESPQLFYRLSLSRYTHTALMRAALLRKLGYYVPSPKFYRNLRLFFRNEIEKENFLKNAQESMISDFDSRGWVSENDKENHSLVFTSATLEPANADYFDIHWGYAPDPNNPQQVAAVQRFSNYRAYRALILPFSLVDVPESINRYSPKFGSVLSGHVVLNHPSAESFMACTYEDAKWLVRRLVGLSDKDIREVVEAAKFPAELEEIVYVKTLYRIRNALELFDLKSSPERALPPLAINSPGGLVRDGKVVKEFVPGYPQRFAHGDRQSPFQDGDVQRYWEIRLKSSFIETAINHLNSKLDLLKLEDVYSDRRKDIFNRITEHMRDKPREPLYQKVEAWGGPVGGFNLSATRHLTTGTYYGSSAPIQLVDNMSVAGRLGFFIGLDGVPTILPSGGANVMVMRDFTHVRPLNSVAEGKKVDWKNLLIPHYMKSLASILESPSTEVHSQQTKPALDKFLLELREGEVFTITDSIVLSGYAQINAPLDVLLGISPVNFLTSLSLGADASRVTLQQVSFMRTREGIQVFVRKQNSKVLGASLDLNYFMNIMRLRSSNSWSDIRSDVFVIDYNPEYSELIDTGKTKESFVQEFLNTRKRLLPALKGLFKGNDPELLYTSFKHKKFEVDHSLNNKQFTSKILMMRLNSFKEDHLLKIRYPRNIETPELDPKDEEVTLFANRRGELRGRDFLTMTLDFIEGVFNKLSPSARISIPSYNDPNPANIPFGKSYWRLISTESDLTENGTQYPSIANVQHVWAGWHLERKRFFKLLNEVQNHVQGTSLGNYRLLEPEAFQNVKAIDFYKVTANLSILPGGLEKIKDLVVQPDSDGGLVQRYQFITGFFQKLSELFGRKARANDKAMYDELIVVLGGGDLSRGQEKLRQLCEEHVRDQNKNSSTPTSPGAWVNGISYDCMLPWISRLIKLSGKYPKDKKAQTQWLTAVIEVLEESIPAPDLLKFLGEENYIYFVRINGFRSGDEDGDLEYFSNSIGDPGKNIEYANGLISMFANKTRISPIELSRTLGGFR